MNEKLKPCPCCGGKGNMYILHMGFDFMFNTGKIYGVQCSKCEWCVTPFPDEQSAIAAWNDDHIYD